MGRPKKPQPIVNGNGNGHTNGALEAPKNGDRDEHRRDAMLEAFGAIQHREMLTQKRRFLTEHHAALGEEVGVRVLRSLNKQEEADEEWTRVQAALAAHS